MNHDMPSLPLGFRVRLRDGLIRAEGGRVLVGGSPTRVVRLSDRALSLLAAGTLTVDDRATARLARRLLDGNLAFPVLDGTAVPRRDLTVVVPVRDRADQLDRCLAALADLPVIVVDDGSVDPDAVARVVRRHDHTLLPLPINVGPAGARNAGLAVVTTPLVAFVDSDVTVTADALVDLARHLSDPRTALVGPQVVGASRGDRPSWFERYDAAASSLDLGRQESQVRAGAEVGWLPSACLVARCDALRVVGGFDATLRVAEDVDLVWRLIDAGQVVRYDPKVKAGHDVRTSMRAWLARKFVYGSGGAALAERHGDKIAPARLSAPMAIGAAAVLQRRWWSLPVAGMAAAATAQALTSRLPVAQDDARVAAGLAVRGLGWAVRQESGLLLRHWWPLTALAAVGGPLSRPVRRAVVSAIAVDLYVFLKERPDVHPVVALVGRRLDDLAYGSGLWWGAIRRRSAGCLAVRRPAAAAARPAGRAA